MISRNGHKYPKMPKKLYGSHSLEAWGYRLGLQKRGFRPVYGLVGILRRDDALLLAGHVGHPPALDSVSSREMVATKHRVRAQDRRDMSPRWARGLDIRQHTRPASFTHNCLSRNHRLRTSCASCSHLGMSKKPSFRRSTTLGLATRQVSRLSRRRKSPSTRNSRKHIQYCLQQKYDWQPVDYTHPVMPRSTKRHWASCRMKRPKTSA